MVTYIHDPLRHRRTRKRSSPSRSSAVESAVKVDFTVTVCGSDKFADRQLEVDTFTLNKGGHWRSGGQEFVLFKVASQHLDSFVMVSLQVEPGLNLLLCAP